MHKLSILGLITLVCLITVSASAEEITFTTYYPAPYGVYRDFQATRNAYFATETDEFGNLVGNVGIGTTGPTGKLHVDVDGDGDGDLFVEDAGANKGKVGIGTASPLSALHVRDSFPQTMLLDNSGERWTQLDWGNNGTRKTFVGLDHTNNIFIIGGQSSYTALDRISIRPNGVADALVVKRSGKVGIGTASPGTKLHVVGSIRIDGDEGGSANTVTLTDIVSAGGTSDPITIKHNITGAPITNPVIDDWLKVYIGTEVYYMPLFK